MLPLLGLFFLGYRFKTAVLLIYYSQATVRLSRPAKNKHQGKKKIRAREKCTLTSKMCLFQELLRKGSAKGFLLIFKIVLVKRDFRNPQSHLCLPLKRPAREITSKYQYLNEQVRTSQSFCSCFWLMTEDAATARYQRDLHWAHLQCCIFIRTLHCNSTCHGFP